MLFCYFSDVWSKYYEIKLQLRKICATICLLPSIMFYFVYVFTGANQQYNVDHLPPLVLHFDFPTNYPSASAPNFTLSAKWLTLAQVITRFDWDPKSNIRLEHEKLS